MDVYINREQSKINTNYEEEGIGCFSILLNRFMERSFHCVENNRTGMTRFLMTGEMQDDVQGV